MEVLERMPFEKKNFMFTKLAEIAEVRKLSADERMAYDQSLKHYRDTYSVMSTLRRETWVEAKAEGRDERNREIALDMLRDGVSPKTVQKYTKLSEDEVKALLAQSLN